MDLFKREGGSSRLPGLMMKLSEGGNTFVGLS
jgi:hypothetical protein